MVDKILALYTRCFALWVILAGLAAYAWPAPRASLDRRSVNCVFALTMFGIGAVLQADDFRRIPPRPGIVVIGTITQYSLMPLVAYAIAEILDLDPQIEVGLILTASAPGAMSSSVVSYIAKADLAHSVSLTTVSTLLAPLVAIGLLMNVLGLVGGYGIAWISRMDVPQRRSLAIEGDMQNAGLGAVLASEHFNDKAAMPAAIFVFVCIITASLLAAYWQWSGRRAAVLQAAG
jgi:predicted Na+-dependent transporter